MRTFYRLVITYEVYEYYNELINRQIEKFPVRKTREEAEADGASIKEESVEEGDEVSYTYKEIEEIEVPID